MTALGIVLHCVVCSEADPLRKWAVLPHRLGELDFGAEGLLGRLIFCECKNGEETEKDNLVRFKLRLENRMQVEREGCTMAIEED